MAPHEILKKGRATGRITKQKKVKSPMKSSVRPLREKTSEHVRRNREGMKNIKNGFDSNIADSSHDESSKSSAASLSYESDTSDDYVRGVEHGKSKSLKRVTRKSIRKTPQMEGSYQTDPIMQARDQNPCRRSTIELKNAHTDVVDCTMASRRCMQVQQNLSRALHDNQLLEIRKVEKNILEAVKVVTNTVSNLRQEFQEYRQQYQVNIIDIQNVVMDGNGKGKSDVTHSNKKGFAHMVLKEFPLLRSQVRCSFSDDMLSEACMKTMCDFFSKAISPSLNGSRDRPSLIGKCISVILFAQQKDMTKQVYKDGIGRQHSNYRFFIVCRSIDLIRSNFTIKKPSFRNAISGICDTQHLNGNELLDRSNSKDGNLPDWVRSESVINADVLKYTRMTYDCPKHQIPRGRETMTFMKGVFITTSIYDVVLDRLRGMRDDSRCLFFESCAFLFYKWSIPGKSDVNWKPKVTFHKSHFEYNPISVPKTNTDGNESATKENALILAETYKTHNEFVIDCSYPIKVIDKNKRPSTSHENSDLRRQSYQSTSDCIKIINRSIHLLEVALIWCLALCRKKLRDESKIEFLGAHEESLQILYRIAYVFHSLLVEKFDKLATEVDSANCEERNIRVDASDSSPSNTAHMNEIERNRQTGTQGYMCHPKFSVSIQDLVCGKESQKRIINNKVLSIRKQQYENLHIPLSSCEGDDDAEIEDQNQNMLTTMSFYVNELQMIDNDE